MTWCRVGVGSVFLLAALVVFSPAASASEFFNLGSAKWPDARIKISLSRSLQTAPNIQGDISEAFQQSLSAWSSASDLRFDVSLSDLVSVSRKGIRGDGVSLVTAATSAENSKLFPNESESPAAVTRVFTDARGRIIEADIVLNPFVRFSTDGAFDTYDLQETLTHEIGHLLGLEHSPVLGSIMFERGSKSFGPGQFANRDRFLPGLDAAAIRALYGSKNDDLRCCGSVSGTLAGIGSQAVGLVWVEESSTGRLIAAAASADNGTFRIEGIPDGDHVVRAFVRYPKGLVSSGEAKVSISTFDTKRANLKLSQPAEGIVPTLLGSSYQLRRASVRFSPVNPTLLLGGDGALDSVVRIGISGTEQWFLSSGAVPFNQNQSVNVIQFDLASLESMQAGEYSILIEDVNGVRSYIPGALILR